MKRSIVKHGPSTLTISLPAKWVKENNLKSGSSLDIEEKGSQLIINTKKQDEFITLNIDIKNNKRTGVRYLNTAHRKGCDELILNYEDPSYLKRIEQCLADEILGYEIIKQGKNFCIIRDIPGTKFDEFDVLFERIWTIIISISEDVLEALKNKDKSAMDSIIALDKRVNKFTNFCMRILNKRGHPKYKNIPVYYNFLRELEELADQYKYLLEYSSKKDIKISEKYMELLTNINESLKLSYKSFYKPKDEDVEYLLAETKRIYEAIEDYSEKSNEKILVAFLFIINDRIRSLLSNIIEINILND